MEFDKDGKLVPPDWVKKEIEKREEQKQSENVIKKIYNDVYNLVSIKYKIVLPDLQIKDVCSSYLPALNTIRILPCLGNVPDRCRQIIIHEFCHAIQNQKFKKHRKGYGHDLKFYRLCVEFGLPFEHDSNDNILKRQAYNENVVSRH